MIIKKFNESTQAKGLDIKNEYTKLINDPKAKTLDLGVVDDVSDTDISNIKQTYKKAIVRVVDGHYILSVKESFNTDVKTFKMFLENNVDSLFNDVETCIENSERLLIQSQPGVTLENDLSEILDELVEDEKVDSYQIINGVDNDISDIDIDSNVIVLLGVDSISYDELIDLLEDDEIESIICVAESIPSSEIKRKFDTIV